jgi:hypothetical protein
MTSQSKVIIIFFYFSLYLWRSYHIPMHIRVICKVSWWGGGARMASFISIIADQTLKKENLQSKITGTQTSFSINFGGKLSFVLSFLVSWAPPLLLHYIHFCIYIYIFASPTFTTTIISLEHCALNAEFQHFILRFNKMWLLLISWGGGGGEGKGSRILFCYFLGLMDLFEWWTTEKQTTLAAY